MRSVAGPRSRERRGQSDGHADSAVQVCVRRPPRRRARSPAPPAGRLGQLRAGDMRFSQQCTRSGYSGDRQTGNKMAIHNKV